MAPKFPLPGPTAGEAPAPLVPRAPAPGAAPGTDGAQAPSTVFKPPLIGHLAPPQQVKVLGIVLAVLLAIAATLIVLDRRHAARITLALSTVTEMQMLSQRLAKSAQESVQGDDAAFGQLAISRDRYAADLALLTDGGERDGTTLPAASAPFVEPLLELGKLWPPVDRSVSLILGQRAALVELKHNERLIDRTAVQLTGLAQQFLIAANDQGESTTVVTLARQLFADTANFDFVDARRQLSTDEPNPSVALQLARNVRNFQATLRSLLEPVEGSPVRPLGASLARDKAEALDKALTPFAASVDGIVRHMQELAGAKQAARAIFAESEPLLQVPRSMIASMQEQEAVRTGLIAAAILCGVLALLTIAAMGKLVIDDARRRAAENEAANQRTQAAILRLLDEMGDLAQGDLTVQARVTEDVTGAIADSVNYAVEEMRRLVQGIIDATGHVAKATSDAQQTAGELLNAAQRQSQEIRDTSAAIEGMAQSIGQVSDRAAESARVAEQSLLAANQGSDAVESAIRGMSGIREQIQDTSKRIKRLGESSQEIGEIVDLISDITEQTNVLALNAAIQASSAGAAGRGFTVVAEEVQRLAERSAEATKQISAIVKTIQTDTQDAIGAMERSTQGVVEQTRLADAAGRALAQIDEVSRHLARLIEAISAATREQAVSASQVARSMGDILGITELTTHGTRRTADSTAQLAELAIDLKQSVAGFKLD